MGNAALHVGAKPPYPHLYPSFLELISISLQTVGAELNASGRFKQ